MRRMNAQMPGEDKRLVRRFLELRKAHLHGMPYEHSTPTARFADRDAMAQLSQEEGREVSFGEIMTWQDVNSVAEAQAAWAAVRPA